MPTQRRLKRGRLCGAEPPAVLKRSQLLLKNPEVESSVSAPPGGRRSLQRAFGEAPSAPGHRFGRFEVRPAERLLLVDGRPAELGARAFDVLVALLQRRERVVSKSELFDLVWPGLVVEENNLATQVSTLRKLLGPATIATIARRGYRFTAVIADRAADNATAPSSIAASEQLFQLEPLVVAAAAATTAASPLASLEPQHAQQRPSIAVLPFTNLSDDAQQEYFADGITEDLLTDLSKLSGLFVISRHSVFAFKNSSKRVEDIAAELGVRYVLEGSVRRSGQTMRVTAQLVDAHDGGHLWAERYDRPIHELFAVQDDVTRHIVQALTVRLSPLEDARIGIEKTASLAAHDCVQRGIAMFWTYTPQALAGAQTLFAQATELDPEYAAAHAWLAMAYINRHGAVFERSDAALVAAREHSRQAVLLDPMLPLAQTATCHIEQWAGQPAAAIAAGRRAIALDPNFADGHAILSMTLSANGQGEEALRMIDIGMRLNPRPTGYFYNVRGKALYLLGRLDEAIAMYRDGLAAWPMYEWNRVALAGCYLRVGRADEARQLIEAFRAASPGRELLFRSSSTDPELRRRHAASMQRLGFVEVA